LLYFWIDICLFLCIYNKDSACLPALKGLLIGGLLYPVLMKITGKQVAV